MDRLALLSQNGHFSSLQQHVDERIDSDILEIHPGYFVRSRRLHPECFRDAGVRELIRVNPGSQLGHQAFHDGQSRHEYLVHFMPVVWNLRGIQHRSRYGTFHVSDSNTNCLLQRSSTAREIENIFPRRTYSNESVHSASVAESLEDIVHITGGVGQV
ncbi:hypothetical protein [Herbaspirillum rubrisubalbicans]|uniref:hypothetical protein n=1 Tax=Herbaspirillum rubrisubalbicans TaxID=80842 RepID=UPI0012FD84DE|nr:hypothetical protein [Herbaspirillum rubrisubalbicans]